MKPFLKIHSCEKMPESMFVAKQDGLEWCLYACLLSGEYGDYQLKHKANHINACPFCGQLLEPQTEQGGVKEVKRPAKIGEYIKVTVPSDVRDGRYEVGDILRVIYDDSNITEQWVGAAVGFENITRPERPWQYCVIRNNNYVVLDGYKPEADNLTIDIKEAFAEINKAIKADVKCTNCRRERINEAISAPKLDPNQIMDRIERILEAIRI